MEEDRVREGRHGGRTSRDVVAGICWPYITATNTRPHGNTSAAFRSRHKPDRENTEERPQGKTRGAGTRKTGMTRRNMFTTVEATRVVHRYKTEDGGEKKEKGGLVGLKKGKEESKAEGRKRREKREAAEGR